MAGKIESRVVLVLFLLLTLLVSCAKEGMPPGGPEDTTPPEVVSVSPETGSTEVASDSEIEISFSERMLAKTTEESIFISPLPKTPFDFRWKGRKLILSPQEPLYPDRTYVISVGADAQDLRRNRLGQTHTFAFSTGSRLDFGSISGEVWIKQQAGLQREMGASIWAYLLTEERSEINAASERPDYATQTDTDGRYVLKNLSMGDYRLFAVQDLNRDLIWDWEKEAIGMTTGDVTLTGQAVSKPDVDFILDRKDRRGPSLLNCLGVNDHLIRLEFDEELDEPSASDPANFEISSVTTGEPLTVTWAFSEHQDARRVFLPTDQMSATEEYEVTVLGIRDKAGNRLDSALSSCGFAGSGIADTLGPEVTGVYPGDGETSVPFDTRIKLAFDEVPDHQSVEASLLLTDSNGIGVPGKGEWSGPNVYVFSPDSLLLGMTTYQIKLSGGAVRDRWGNVSEVDSAFVSRFTTLDPDTLGSVSGAVEINQESDSFSAILTLWHLEQNELFYQLSVSGLGSFRFQAVLPGKYFLGGYLDLDGDGMLSLGQPLPFSPMEPFAVLPDTIHVRSRWETEEVKLRLR